MTSILLDYVAPLNTYKQLPNDNINNTVPSPIASQNITILPSVMILQSKKNNSTLNTIQTSNNNDSIETPINSESNNDDVTGDDQYPTICLVQ